MSLESKEVLMNGSDYIELDSVGSTLTKDLLVFPTDCSEAPETASEAEEMMGVHIMDTDDDWWSNMSCKDCVTLFSFLANTKIYEIKDYFKWALPKSDFVAKANGHNTLAVAAIEDGWDIDDYLWTSKEAK